MDFPTSYLDVDDVLEIFEALIGSPKTLLRSYDLLESAVLAPQQSAFGQDAYPRSAAKRGRIFGGSPKITRSSTATSASLGRQPVRSCSSTESESKQRRSSSKTWWFVLPRAMRAKTKCWRSSKNMAMSSKSNGAKTQLQRDDVAL